MADNDDDIDELDAPLTSTTPSPVCFGCMRWHGVWQRCDAFGDKPIPDLIWLDGNTHRKPVEGDGGKLFEPPPKA